MTMATRIRRRKRFAKAVSGKRNRELKVRRASNKTATPTIGQIFLLASDDASLEGCLGVLLEKDARAPVGYIHPLYTPPYDGLIDLVDEDIVVQGDALTLPYVTNAVVRPSVRARVPLEALDDPIGTINLDKSPEFQRQQKSTRGGSSVEPSLSQAWALKVDSLVRRTRLSP